MRWLPPHGVAAAAITAVSADVASRGAAHQEQNRPPVFCLLQAGHSMAAIADVHFGTPADLATI